MLFVCPSVTSNSSASFEARELKCFIWVLLTQVRFWRSCLPGYAGFGFLAFPKKTVSISTDLASKAQNIWLALASLQCFLA